jgi:alkylhydroperoxidase/carboxymuconolactone decarboxylase family protein YurZ
MSKKPKKNPDFTVRLVSARESSLDRKLLRLIYIALGEASMCWDSPQSAGVFHSQEAIKVGAKLKEDIKDLIRNK